MRDRLATAFILMMGAVACTSEGDPSSASDEDLTGCGAAARTSAAAASTDRSVSFAADVLPIFVKSCSFGSCHGTAKNAADNGVFLGSKSEANDARAIRAALVGRPSTQSPSTLYVKPADPAGSYLYLKLTGDLCGLAECSGDRCGKPMPRGGDPLDPAALDTVRTWILQGAPD